MRRGGVFRSRYKRDSSGVTVLTRTNTGIVAGTVIIAIFAILAIFADVFTTITGNNPYSEHPEILDSNSVPVGQGGISFQHWFGVTPLRGLDIFAIISHGARVSLGIGIASTVISLFLGILIGMIAGYFGGFADTLLSRTMDVVFGFPFLIFAIALSAVVPQNFPRPILLTLVLGFFGLPSIARLVRAQTLSLKSRNFTVASYVMGANTWHILREQIMPNMLPLLLVNVTFLIPGRIGAEAALSFLGVGMNPPSPSWGRAIADAVQWVLVDPWYLLFPGIALFLLTFGFNLVGDGLASARQPRASKKAVTE